MRSIRAGLAPLQRMAACPSAGDGGIADGGRNVVARSRRDRTDRGAQCQPASRCRSKCGYSGSNWTRTARSGKRRLTEISWCFPRSRLVQANQRQMVRVQWLGRAIAGLARLLCRDQPVARADRSGEHRPDEAIGLGAGRLSPQGAGHCRAAGRHAESFRRTGAPDHDRASRQAWRDAPANAAPQPGISVTVRNTGKRHAMMAGVKWTIQGKGLDNKPLSIVLDSTQMGNVLGAGYLPALDGRRTFEIPTGHGLFQRSDHREIHRLTAMRWLDTLDCGAAGDDRCMGPRRAAPLPGANSAIPQTRRPPFRAIGSASNVPAPAFGRHRPQGSSSPVTPLHAISAESSEQATAANPSTQRNREARRCRCRAKVRPRVFLPPPPPANPFGRASILRSMPIFSGRISAKCRIHMDRKARLRSIPRRWSKC